MVSVLYRLQCVPVTESTNADAKKAAQAGEAEGLVVQALRQTAGRGRLGRVWESPEGNLFVSVLLRPRCSTQEGGLYSFVAALAVRDTVREFLPQADIKLKWPNDVLVDGKKISGILLETELNEMNEVAWLVVGVGINVLHCPENGASLHKLTCHSREIEVEAVLEIFLANFEKWRQVFLSEGFAPIRTAWLENAKTGVLTARLPQEVFEGEFVGLDERGSLILRLAEGSERTIASGDVF